VLSARGAESALGKAKRYGSVRNSMPKLRQQSDLLRVHRCDDLLELGLSVSKQVWYDIVTRKLLRASRQVDPRKVT